MLNYQKAWFFTLGGSPLPGIWQRNYYEHIIRNEREMDNIWRYIEANPSMWADDDENPNNVGA